MANRSSALGDSPAEGPQRWRIHVGPGAEPEVRPDGVSIRVGIEPMGPHRRGGVADSLEVRGPTLANIANLRRYFGRRWRDGESDWPRQMEERLEQIGAELGRPFEQHQDLRALLLEAHGGSDQVTWEIRGPARVQGLPWELVRMGELPLRPALAGWFRRWNEDFSVIEPAWPRLSRVRVLWVIARPGSGGPSPGAVLEPVQARLGDRLEVVAVEEGRYAEMVRRIESVPPGYFHLLHLDMHGLVSPWREFQKSEAGDAKRVRWNDRFGRGDLKRWEGDCGLVFFSDDGLCDPVTSGELAAMVARARIPVVVLNACESSQVPEQGPGVALTEDLVRSGTPAALGFSEALTAGGARRFFEAFYESLAEGEFAGSCDQAVLAGRRALQTVRQRGGFELVDWSLPVWYAASEVRLPVRLGRVGRGGWRKRASG